MAITLCALRMSEDFRLKQENELKIAQDRRIMTQLSSFSTAAANGNISPGMVGGLGLDIFEEAMEFMENAAIEAENRAEYQVGLYQTQFNNMASNDAYQYSSFMQNAQMYLDESGQLDVERLKSEFYEQAIKDYANEVLTPAITAKETEIQNEINALDAENQMLTAEYDKLKQQRSDDIQRAFS